MENFISHIIKEDLENGAYDTVVTRFPPEPNGHLHLGHAKSIFVNFELVKMFGGKTNLRFDDSNPVKESYAYVEAIRNDITWLGYTPKSILYASNYFDAMHQKALLLIEKGLAYVCDLSPNEMGEYRGTLTDAGRNSPFRDRSVADNLARFEKMKTGSIAEGACVLRAKIDMGKRHLKKLVDDAVVRGWDDPRIRNFCEATGVSKAGGVNERKPRGNIHYVEATTAVPTEFNFYESLFVGDEINPNSLKTIRGFVESGLENLESKHFQMVRNGYCFAEDGALNEITPLKTSFKI